MNKLIIVIPAYNEQDNIESCVREWYPKLSLADDTSRLLIVNDGSTDGTLDILNRMQGDYPRLTVLNKKNGGHGSALIEGYNYAINDGADYIFQTDSDGQTNPDEFDEFWENRCHLAAIFGSRPDRDDGKVRVLVEKIVCFLIKIIFKVRVPDANCPFRLMRADVLERYMKYIPDNFVTPNILITACFKADRQHIMFRRITFKSRRAGPQKINIRKIINIGLTSVPVFISTAKRLKTSDLDGCKEDFLNNTF